MSIPRPLTPEEIRRLTILFPRYATMPSLIDTEELASILRITASHLANDRSGKHEIDIGYIKLGKSRTSHIRYYKEEVARYLIANTHGVEFAK